MVRLRQLLKKLTKESVINFFLEWFIALIIAACVSWIFLLALAKWGG